jgi:hypothetical protein
MDEGLPTNIMSPQPWNTVSERNILMDLMELILQAMEEDNRANVSNLDNYLMGLQVGDDDMDSNTLPSVESDKPIDDLDLSKTHLI